MPPRPDVQGIGLHGKFTLGRWWNAELFVAMREVILAVLKAVGFHHAGAQGRKGAIGAKKTFVGQRHFLAGIAMLKMQGLLGQIHIVAAQVKMQAHTFGFCQIHELEV